MEGHGSRSVTPTQVLAYKLSLILVPSGWLLVIPLAVVTRLTGHSELLDSPRFTWYIGPLPCLTLIGLAGVARVIAFSPVFMNSTGPGKPLRSKTGWRLAMISAMLCPLAMAWNQTLAFGGLIPHDKLDWLILSVGMNFVICISAFILAAYLVPADEHAFLRAAGIARSYWLNAARTLFYLNWPLLGFNYLNKVAADRRRLSPSAS